MRKAMKLSMCKSLLVLAILATTSLFSGLSGQTPIDLRFNGAQQATAPVGSLMQISMNTTPYVWGNIIFSANPGPTTVYGYTIPIGFDATTIFLQNTFTDGTGLFQTVAALPDNLALEGLTYYAYAYTYDASDPTGFGASNQASVTFTRHVTPGTDTAGFVAQPVTLDGGGILAQGPLPAGMTLAWSIANGPTGHNAALDGTDTAFPTLTADIAGTYEIALDYSFPGTTGGASASVFVDIFDLNVTSHTQGAFDTSDPINYSAVLNGPAATNFGAPGGTTAGNAITGSIPAAAVVTDIGFDVTAASGQRLGQTLSVINNSGAPMSVSPADSLAIHLKQPVLDSLAMSFETAVAQSSLTPPASSFPTIPITGIPFTTGTVTIQSVSFEPNIDLQLTLQNGSIGCQITLYNFMMVFDITGSIFFVPFTDTGTYTASSIVLSFDLVPTIVGGMYQTTTANETATVNGATLTFTNGALNASSGLILATLTPAVEAAIVATIPPLVPPLVDTALNSIPQAVDLSAGGPDITLNFIPSSINIAPSGMTLAYAAGAQPNNIAPGAPVITSFYGTPSALPAYGANVPGTMQPYNFASSMADDMLNQILAAATLSGDLSLSLDQGFMVGGTMIPATAAGFATALPGLGFEKFDGTNPVRILLEPQVAPIVTIDNMGGTSNYTVHTANTLVNLVVDVTPTHTVSVARLSASASTALGVTVDLVNNILNLTPGSTSASLRLISTMPGVDITTSLSVLTTLINTILPGATLPVTGIPLPAAPMVGGTMMPPTLVGITADGPLGDYLSIFLNQ